MNELENEIVKDLQNTIEGKMFLKYKSENGLDAANLIDSVKNIIARHQIPVPVSKGFLEYMKIVIEHSSCIPIQR